MQHVSNRLRRKFTVLIGAPCNGRSAPSRSPFASTTRRRFARHAIARRSLATLRFHQETQPASDPRRWHCLAARLTFQDGIRKILFVEDDRLQSHFVSRVLANNLVAQFHEAIIHATSALNTANDLHPETAPSTRRIKRR